MYAYVSKNVLGNLVLKILSLCIYYCMYVLYMYACMYVLYVLYMYACTVCMYVLYACTFSFCIL